MPVLAPPAGGVRRKTEEILISVLRAYGYKEMRFPVLEKTELFRRSVGDATDIVEKEMYEFKDKSDQSVCLRPEGTAGLLRAGIQTGLFAGQKQRLWYLGPMFRYERPQSGRLRQFDQIGAEAIGFEGADADTEMILICASFWQALGLKDLFLPKLQVNLLGSAAERKKYGDALVRHFASREEELPENDRRRLKTAPLRLQDSKDPVTVQLLADAPSLTDYVSAKSRETLQAICEQLKQLEIPCEVNPRLVRGLDYYTDIVFEWVCDGLDAQNTVCAGGRYDALPALLGGKPTAATGFAMGMERLLLLLERANCLPTGEAEKTQVLLVCLTDSAKMLSLRHKIWSRLPRLCVESALGSPSLKSALKKADKQKIPFVVILGEEEEDKDLCCLRDMRTGEQTRMKWDNFFEKMQTII